MANRIQNMFRQGAKFLNSTLPSEAASANDKYDIFDDVDQRRQEKTNELAISLKKTHDYGRNPRASVTKDASYYQFVYTQLDQNKTNRVLDYRQLGKNPKISDCIDEYKQACINRQKDEDLISFSLEGIPEGQVEEVQKEWQKFVKIFHLRKKGRGIIDDLLTEGEVFWENVVSKSRPDLGILDVKRIPTENIDPFYSNVSNDDIDHFLLKKKTEKPGDPTQYDTSFDTSQLTPMHRYQVTYAHSGEWDSTHKYRIPFIEKARQSQKRLTLIEDSIVVNAMVNAPDRLMFNVATGNMPDAQARQYMQKFIQDFYRKRGIDPDGNVVDQFNPLSVTEAIFTQKGRGQDNTTVERLAGSQAFGNNFSEMLQYFHNAVYEDMHVPVSRLNAESQASDGTVATFQEIAFGERVKDLQIQLSEAVKDTFITHLKLRGIRLHSEGITQVLTEQISGRLTEGQKLSPDFKVPEILVLEQHFRMVSNGTYGTMCGGIHGSDPKEVEKAKESYTSLWDNYRLEEEMIDVDFSLPGITLALREQQYFELKVNQFNQLAANENFSVYYLAKKYLDWTDKEIEVNREWKRVEAEEFWETSNIMEDGPDFRQKLADELAGAMSGGGAGGDLGDTGSALDLEGGDLGGGGDLDTPETGEEGGSQEDAPLPDFGAGQASEPAAAGDDENA